MSPTTRFGLTAAGVLVVVEGNSAMYFFPLTWWGRRSSLVTMIGGALVWLAIGQSP
jgi:hypothetical protein